MRYYLFFSYARNDAKAEIDPYLRKFFCDLRREVSLRAAVEEEQIGFLDVDQQTGSTWPEVTGEAVGTCNVFVPVYSPWYFASDMCGREWHAFERRLQQHRVRTGDKLVAILPVWWIPPQHLPPVTEFLHDTRDQFGAKYRESGLRSLAKLTDHRDEYEAFVEAFAIQVFEAGKTPPKELGGVDLRNEPSAFTRRVPTPAAAAVSGPKRVNFVVAAGSSEQMQTLREALDAYGEEWLDWRPYVPDCPDPVVLKCQGVAGGLDLVSGPAPVDDLIDVLDRAKQRREIVALIIDPWAVGIGHYHQLLAELDDRRYHNVTILLPGTEGEVRTLSNGQDADDLLRMCIGNWLDDESRAVRQNLSTVTKFEAELRRALIDTSARIVNRADVARRVQQGGATSRPVLIGPEG